MSGEHDEPELCKNTAHPERALMKAISGPWRLRRDSPAASPELGGVGGLTGRSSAGGIKKKKSLAFFFFFLPAVN